MVFIHRSVKKVYKKILYIFIYDININKILKYTWQKRMERISSYGLKRKQINNNNNNTTSNEVMIIKTIEKIYFYLGMEIKTKKIMHWLKIKIDFQI